MDGVLLNKMNTTVDGEFQKFATEDAAQYVRESISSARTSTAEEACGAP